MKFGGTNCTGTNNEDGECATQSCLQCYQCNSTEDEACLDPFVDEPTTDGEKPKVKAEAANFLKPCPGEESLCRKTDQFVIGEATGWGGHVRHDTSVIRSCATEKYENDCYETILEGYNATTCTCEGDGCNHAALASLAITIALMALLAVAFFVG